jgi:hypothetical protein
VLLAFGDVAVDETVCLAEHVQSMESSMMSVGKAKVVEADGCETHKNVASHRRGCPFPVDEFWLGELVNKCRGTFRLNFAVNRKKRESFNDVCKAAGGLCVGGALAVCAARR